MIARLRCVDNSTCDHFTKDKVYESTRKELGMHLVTGDDGFSYRVNVDSETNIWSDKWEFVK